jgi:DNA end-binding protein Ku
LEPRDQIILVTTLRAHDEVRDADAMPGAHAAPKASREMLEIAGQLIDQNAGEFDPTAFVDRYEDAVRKLVEQKGKGHKPVRAERGSGYQNAEVVDLMKMLRESISGGRRRANDNAPRAAAARRSTPTKAGPKPSKRGRAA